MISGQPNSEQAAGAGWPARWFGRLGAGTSGARQVTNGALPPPRALLAIAGFVALVDAVNVLTVLHDASRHGQHLPAWEAITWEASSGIAELAVCGIIYAALQLAPLSRAGWRRCVAVHGTASLVFSAGHIGLMLALRYPVYAAAGLHYHWDRGDIPYEYRKDALAYLVLAGMFQAFARKPAAAPVQANAPPQHFDIVDGARILRAPLTDIMAIRAAGNYAEFFLADGSTRLMRITLRETEKRLEPAGFTRTHRGWLVNAARVVALAPAGSGDYEITLGGGVRAPLSRRFPEALARLRA
jgi:DNA-binding LytR/AlgR family response regulator